MGIFPYKHWIFYQWEYVVGIFPYIIHKPYIGLIYGRYLQFLSVPVAWPLILRRSCDNFGNVMT